MKSMKSRSFKLLAASPSAGARRARGCAVRYSRTWTAEIHWVVFLQVHTTAR